MLGPVFGALIALSSTSYALANLSSDLMRRNVPQLQVRDQEIFQQEGLCNRWAHQSVIKSEKLFLFGGNMLLKKDNDTGVEEATNDNFLELDLSQSFDIGEGLVPWKQVQSNSEKTPPYVSGGALYEGKGDFLYLYEGQVPKTMEEQVSSIWGYDIKKQEWGVTNTWRHDDNRFPNRQSLGAPVKVPGSDVGYYIGGVRAYENETFKGWYYPPSEQFTTIDLSTGKKKKSEKLPLKQKRIGPNVVHLPIGEKGILVLVGGTGEYKVRLAAPKENGGIDPNDIRVNPMSQMDTIWIYDIAKDVWHYQTAVGDMPWERKNFCMVAASTPGANGTHHIYIYGGGTDYKTPMLGMNDTTYDDMYILSIPSFRYWQVPLGDYKPAVRQKMTCHVVNNSQMLVLGGHHVNSSQTVDDCKWDEMNLFDMYNLKWLDKYEPSSDNIFKAPDDLISALGADTQNPAAGWDDDNLKNLFRGTEPGCPISDAVQQRATKTLKTVAIAGGVCMALSLMTICLCCVFLRRRKRENKILESELEQLQLYLQYQAHGEIVSERDRPMTFWEKVEFVFGTPKVQKPQEFRVMSSPSFDREKMVEQIP